jgi:hypothetical protein
VKVKEVAFDSEPAICRSESIRISFVNYSRARRWSIGVFEGGGVRGKNANVREVNNSYYHPSLYVCSVLVIVEGTVEVSPAVVFRDSGLWKIGMSKHGRHYASALRTKTKKGGQVDHQPG